IDRQYIIDTVGQCEQEIATTFIPSAMLDGHGGEFKTDDADYTYPVSGGYYEKEPNVDAAIALLEEAGFKFENGMLSPETPITFEYLTNDSSGNVAIAECVQQDLAAIGVDMTIKSVEWNVFLNERKAGNFGIARNGWLADFNDPVNMLEMWTTVSGNNDAQFGR
ncbi:MAG: ABC transporter substrate-binding protein, partial [Clostridia bacterium]